MEHQHRDVRHSQAWPPDAPEVPSSLFLLSLLGVHIMVRPKGEEDSWSLNYWRTRMSADQKHLPETLQKQVSFYRAGAITPREVFSRGWGHVNKNELCVSTPGRSLQAGASMGAESLPCCSRQTPLGCPWPGLAGDPACGLTTPRPASLLCCPVVVAMLGSRELWSPARPWHLPAWHTMPPWPSPSAT